MSALGIAASGAGQGYAQGVDWRNQRNNQQRQFEQSQQQIDLERQRLQDTQSNARRQEGLTRAGQLEAIFRDPNSARLYRPGELDKLRAEYEAIKTQYPDLYPGSAPQVPGEVLPGGPVAAAAAETNPPQPAAQPSPIPELYNLGHPQAAPDPLNAMNVGTGASDFNPMSEQPITPGAPITGSQNPPVAGSFPLDPRVAGQAAPAPVKIATPAKPATAPAPVTAVMRVEQLAKQYLEMAADPKYSEAEQEHFQQLATAALDQASQLRNRESGTQQNIAQTHAINVGTEEAQKTGHAQRQQIAESIASSLYERKVLNPQKISLEQAAQSISRGQLALQRLSENHQDKNARAQIALEAKKLGVSVDQFAKELGFKYAELGVQKQIAGINAAAKAKPGGLTDTDKIVGQVLGKAGVQTTPMGEVKGPSPMWNTFVEWARAHGTGVPGAESAGGGDQVAKVKAYLSRTDLTPEQKIGGLKQLGIPPPPELLRKARGANARH